MSDTKVNQYINKMEDYKREISLLKTVIHKHKNMPNIISKKNDDASKTYSVIKSSTDTSSTEIYLIRHGRTYWNNEHRMQGQQNSDLTDGGIKGAINVGKRLNKIHKQRKFDIMISSPLGRTKQTTNYILSQFDSNDKPELIWDKRLMERNFGKFQGYTRDEFKDGWEDEFQECSLDVYKKMGDTGESADDLNKRVTQFINDVSNKYAGKRILVVSHGGTIQYMLFHVIFYERSQNRSFNVKNTAINIIERKSKNDDWFITLLGDDDHETRINDMNYAKNAGIFVVGLVCGIGLIMGYNHYKQSK